LVDKLAESSLVLDETESDVLLSAELRKPNNGFNRVNIVSNNDESSFLFFDELGDVVKTELNSNGSLDSGFSVYENDKMGCKVLLSALALAASSNLSFLFSLVSGA